MKRDIRKQQETKRGSNERDRRSTGKESSKAVLPRLASRLSPLAFPSPLSLFHRLFELASPEATQGGTALPSFSPRLSPLTTENLPILEVEP